MKTVTVTGGDLYRLALKYLGSAEQWNRIVQANLSPAGGAPMDVVLSGIVTLNMPSVNPDATGGILAL
jgi:hypothetical protein